MSDNQDVAAGTLLVTIDARDIKAKLALWPDRVDMGFLVIEQDAACGHRMKFEVTGLGESGRRRG